MLTVHMVVTCGGSWARSTHDGVRLKDMYLLVGNCMVWTVISDSVSSALAVSRVRARIVCDHSAPTGGRSQHAREVSYGFI